MAAAFNAMGEPFRTAIQGLSGAAGQVTEQSTEGAEQTAGAGNVLAKPAEHPQGLVAQFRT